MEVLQKLAIVLVAGAVMAGTAQGAAILVDMGDVAGIPSGNWNCLTDYHAGAAVTNAIDSDGNATAVDIEITTRFGGEASVGSVGSTVFPDAAADDGFWGRDNYQPTNQLTVSDLTPGVEYTFTFYAATTSTTYNYEAQWTAAGGSGGGTVALNGAGNTSNTVSVGVTPTAGGVVTIDIQKGPNNNAFPGGTDQGRYYFNTMTIEAVPEPATLGLLALGGSWLACRRRR